MIRKIKNILLITILSLMVNCKSENDINIDTDNLYPYGTKKFKQWENSKKIKLKEAFQIHYKYSLEHLKDSKKSGFKGYPLSYSYGNFYVFSTVTNVHKLGEFNLTGIWVNADTGEAKEIIVPAKENFKTSFYWVNYYGQ